MAQKKITDLQLISALVDSANYVVDTGVQTYRSTATQLMTYIYSKLNALSQVTPLAGDNVLLLDASDSNNPKRILFSSIKNSAYRSVTTTDSVGADDETMVLSGASFTSTLPTAVGVAGKRYKFIHRGTSGTQIYTLATTSSQTIGGYASGAYILYQSGDSLEIESDGANWIIISERLKPLIVNAKNTAGTALAGSGAETLLPFVTEAIDTHSAWSTDTFTAPFDMTAEYSCRAAHASFGSTYGICQIIVKKNTTVVGAVAWGKASATATVDGSCVHGVVNLAAGDTLKFYYYNGGSAQALNTTDENCGISIIGRRLAP